MTATYEGVGRFAKGAKHLGDHLGRLRSPQVRGALQAVEKIFEKLGRAIQRSYGVGLVVHLQ